MVSFRIFLLILVTLASCQLVDWPSSIDWTRSLLICIASVLGFSLLVKMAALARLSKLDAKTPSGGELLSQLDRMQSFRQNVESAWIMAFPVVMIGGGMQSWLHHLELLDAPHAFIVALAFLPSVILIVANEATMCQYSAILHRDDDGAWISEFWARLRMGDLMSLVVCLTPVLLITAFVDLGSRVAPPTWNAYIPPIAGILMLVFFAIGFPWFLSSLMQAQALNSMDAGTRVQSLVTSTRVRGLQSLLIPSAGRWSGAAVVGWIPGFRQLWISDGLLDQLSAIELDMVVLHELAHVRRRHSLIRILPITAAALAGYLCWYGLDLLVPSLLSEVQVAVSAATTILVLILTIAAASHWCELDADRSACFYAQTICVWAGGERQAGAQQLAQALTTLLSDQPRAAAATWLHPSLERRLANLAVQ